MISKKEIEEVSEANQEIIVYECWTNEAHSFHKFETMADVNTWVADVMADSPMHTHIHIVKHLSSEYH